MSDPAARWSHPASMPFYDYDAMHPDVRQRQDDADARPERRSLYTTVKRDHEHPLTTGEPCRCRDGEWEKFAMRVTFPPQADREPG
jgi:hypothetical protein